MEGRKKPVLVCSVHRMSHLKTSLSFWTRVQIKQRTILTGRKIRYFQGKKQTSVTPIPNLTKMLTKTFMPSEDNLSRDHRCQRRMGSLLPGTGMPRLRKSQLPCISQKEAHSWCYTCIPYPPTVPSGWVSGLCPSCFHFLPSL